ncbi:phosphoribosylanthranilate isomerase [Uliginosibacterium sp. H3]|uniref:N-(5'-phosphoribosyl)anthranilate isomerase n=1 Tax=Uliginosibacterium silvisoli TaxID=3114758 RepID=A0ABU6K963_9RHOO|nr:phosphoribosylanthranilate isomerase [Uliginosibacterium sp. H3]
MNTRTRVKICGITREEDLDAAVNAGADAIGLNFYPPSPRSISIERAAALCKRVPPFVTITGLFVNAEEAYIREHLAALPLGCLQFHGDEVASQCGGYGLPYIKAARVRAGVDLLNYAASFPDALGILLDAWVEGYGGGGKTFDWDLIPQSLPVPLILSGGLEAENVAEAIRHVQPWAVDVSSGVEVTPGPKGIKDAARIAAFMKAVAGADNADR